MLRTESQRENARLAQIHEYERRMLSFLETDATAAIGEGWKWPQLCDWGKEIKSKFLPGNSWVLRLHYHTAASISTATEFSYSEFVWLDKNIKFPKSFNSLHRIVSIQVSSVHSGWSIRESKRIQNSNHHVINSGRLLFPFKNFSQARKRNLLRENWDW